MSFGQVYFIKFVLFLPEWVSGDKNLCSTLIVWERYNYPSQALVNLGLFSIAMWYFGVLPILSDIMLEVSISPTQNLSARVMFC